MQNSSMAAGAGGRSFRIPSFADLLRILTSCGITPLSPCATLPDANRVESIAQTEPVTFENARGTVSKSTSAAILNDLKSESGPSDILQKHLALEETINRDSPLVLGNWLVSRDRAAAKAIDPEAWKSRSPLLRIQEWLARRFEYWL